MRIAATSAFRDLLRTLLAATCAGALLAGAGGGKQGAQQVLSLIHI